MNALNFISNEFVSAKDGATLAHIDPSTGQEDLRLADSGLLDVVAAIQAANGAKATWTKTTPQERRAFLETIATKIEERGPILSEAQSRDQGSLMRENLAWSIPKSVGWFRHHARLLDQAPVAHEKSGIAYTANRLPIGVVGIITPWVDPLVVLASRVSAALAAGNCVIVKPSEFAPRTAQLFAEIIRDSGLPTGVFSLLQGRGERVGQSLVEHPGLSTLSFVGSTETGRRVSVLAAESLKRIHLSLGARNPVLVFASCDLGVIVPQVVRVTMGAHPHSSWRGSRLFVQDPIYKEFLEAYKSEVEKIKIGPALDPSTQLGPLPAASFANKFDEVLNQATKEKGKWLFGGSLNSKGGAFVTPSATFDFTLCSTLQQDEIVGPIVTIASFKYQHDAVKQANNSPLGQVAYVFEKDPTKALSIAQKIEAGRVFINTSEPFDDFEFAAGGLKLSGLARENSDELFKFFSREILISSHVSR